MGATTRQPRRNLYDACRDCEHSIPSYGRCRAGYGKIKEDCQGQVNGLTPTLDSLLLFCKGREQGGSPYCGFPAHISIILNHLEMLQRIFYCPFLFRCYI